LQIHAQQLKSYYFTAKPLPPLPPLPPLLCAARRRRQMLEKMTL